MRMSWFDWIKAQMPHWRRTPKVKPAPTKREPVMFKLVYPPTPIDDVMALTKSEARAIFKKRLGVKTRHFTLKVEKVA